MHALGQERQERHCTGRLMWCKTVPFGFVDSPRIFCSVTEAIAQEFRRRVAKRMIHGKVCNILCYVDDYLLVGDDEQATREGGEILEELLFELGFEWAPHKQRGPCRCIEFLGLLLCNTPEKRCIALSRGRQEMLTKKINEWLARRPKRGELTVEPKDLARLLGHLVFASQVVSGGRVYMQSMLSQFSGLTVDWRRGEVKYASGKKQEGVTVNEGFWRDLEWWSDHMSHRNCISLVAEAAGEAAITGTDASDWGTGQAVFIDGGLEESRLQFTTAEKRRRGVR